MWLALLLVPALAVFATHLLLLALWQRAAIWRVRRRVERALDRGDSQSLLRAASLTSDAARDWSGRRLWSLGKAVEITLRRAQHAA